jgi:hypothetical protein
MRFAPHGAPWAALPYAGIGSPAAGENDGIDGQNGRVPAGLAGENDIARADMRGGREGGIPKQYVLQLVFGPPTRPVNASLLQGLSFVLLFLGISYFKYRTRRFVGCDRPNMVNPAR